MRTKMTLAQKRAVALFVLARDWVLFTIGLLMVGVCLLALPSNYVRERSVGVVLAALLLVAMGLYLWMRLRRDLLNGQVAEEEIEVSTTKLERHDASTYYFLLDPAAVRYEVSAELYERAQPGECYRLVYTLGSRIVLSAVRMRKL